MEGGIRVPMFMHWPERIKAGAVFDHPVLGLDLYPTFAALGGASIPEAKIVDGSNIWDDLQADNNPHASDPMFWLRHHGSLNEIAIRRGNLKAYRKGFGKWKMFDVSTDFGEAVDIAHAHPEVLRTLILDGKKMERHAPSSSMA